MLMITPEMLRLIRADQEKREAIRIIRSDQAKRDEKERLKRLQRKLRRLSDDRAGRLVGSMARILRTGEPTYFEFEASCRHGLRQSLIFEGWRWGDADLCAADIVRQALTSIGAVRPTWEQGQPESAANYRRQRWYCGRCGGLLDENDRGQRRYCSKLCSNAAGKERAALSGEAVSRAEYVARLALKREERLKASIGKCETCHKPFIGSHPGVRFCSQVCHSKSRLLHKPRACAGCGTVFQPISRGKNEVQKFCSMACAAANRGGERKKAPRPQLICEKCGEGFSARYPSIVRRFCSLQCSSQRPRNRRTFACKAVPPERDIHQEGGR